MLKIALVGNIASGKSTVEKIFEDNNFFVADTDKITHNLLNTPKVMDDLKQYFGEVIFENNLVSRQKLGKIVFEDEEKRKILENILHPLIKQKILNIFEQKKEEKAVIISVPLLFEAGMQNMFDKIIFVSSNLETRLERLIKRNSLTREEALLRINSQGDEELKIKQSDFIIKNNSSLNDLKSQVEDFIKNNL